jgi:hypothetical protein
MSEGLPWWSYFGIEPPDEPEDPFVAYKPPPVLVIDGVPSEEDIKALAEHLGVEYEPLEEGEE